MKKQLSKLILTVESKNVERSSHSVITHSLWIENESFDLSGPEDDCTDQIEILNMDAYLLIKESRSNPQPYEE